MLVPEYCYGVQVEQINRKLRKKEVVEKACVKIKDGKCTAYDPCKKLGLERGGYLGCSFSPLEIYFSDNDEGKTRVGQQKQKKRR